MKKFLSRVLFLCCGTMLGLVGCNAVEKFKEGVEWADTKRQEFDADLNKKADVLEAKGIDVDHGTAGLIESAKKDPVTAWEGRGAYLSILAAMALGWVRTKASKGEALAALGVVTKVVETAPPEVQTYMKTTVAARGGKRPAINAAIQKSLV